MRYARDPYWLTARYAGSCASCGAPIARGERAFYYPTTKGLYGEACGHGEANSRDFEAAAFDESAMTGNW